MKNDLKDTTFIIPIRIESVDRLRNVITVCCFLLETFDTKVIIKEVDKASVFVEQALPQITEYVGEDIKNLTHVFEQSEDQVFYRMRYLNEMLDMCETPVVANYDCDVLLPIDTCLQAQQMLTSLGHDVVYPYGQGVWQKRIYADDEMVSEFLSNDCDFSILERKHDLDNAESGHVQFFRADAFRAGGMENENFQGSSPEDKERAETMVKEMAAAQERISQTPVAVVISTHLMGLYELAAIHLSQQPPNLKDASLAIDALGAVMEKLANQLGESEETLRDALHQIRMAYVSLEQREDLSSEEENSEAD